MNKEQLLGRIADECVFEKRLSQHTIGLVLREVGETHDYRPAYRGVGKHQVLECWCGLKFNSPCHFPDQKLLEMR